MTSANVCTVLGVGPGLGAAVARRFAREGYAVALMARSHESLAAVQADIERQGGRAVSVLADATDEQSVATAMEEARTRFGPSSVFVYNAGMFRPGGVLETSPSDFETAWRANCFGAYVAVREALPPMLENRRGTILLTGATASLRGSARFASLAVGKFGLRALAQSLARELGPSGIHVAHVIIDGQIDTPRLRSFQPDRPANTLLDPEAIADTYWQLHQQSATAWTLEIDLRPAVEKF